jgi:hypothetical protein
MTVATASENGHETTIRCSICTVRKDDGTGPQLGFVRLVRRPESEQTSTKRSEKRTEKRTLIPREVRRRTKYSKSSKEYKTSHPMSQYQLDRFGKYIPRRSYDIDRIRMTWTWTPFQCVMRKSHAPASQECHNPRIYHHHDQRL